MSLFTFKNIKNCQHLTSIYSDQATITALPFAASSEVGLDLGIGLYAELLLGISIENNGGDIDASGFADLPYLNISITQVSEVDENCNPMGAATDSTTAYSNMTHIVYDVLLDVGVEVEFDIDADTDADAAIISLSSGAEATLMKTTMELPTSCLSWDSSKATFQTLAGSIKEDRRKPNRTKSHGEKSYGGNMYREIAWVWGAAIMFCFMIVL